jgi:ferredoxin
MALTVEITERCQGHGRCFTICPEVFAPDEEGFSTVLPQALPTTPADLEDAVRSAVAACPEHAISCKVVE